MPKKSSASDSPNGWLADEQLPLDSFFSNNSSTSRSQTSRTADKGKRRNSSNSAAVRPAKKPRLSIREDAAQETDAQRSKQKSIEDNAGATGLVAWKGRKTERTVLDDITSVANTADKYLLDGSGVQAKEPYLTPDTVKRRPSLRAVAREIIEVPETSDEVRPDSDPAIESTLNRAPITRSMPGGLVSKGKPLPSSQASSSKTSTVAPPVTSKSKAGEIVEVPESSDDAHLESDGAFEPTPCRPPASGLHAENALPTPPPSILPPRNHPTASRISNCATPLSQGPLAKLRCNNGVSTKTPTAPPISTAFAYPTPESLLRPRLAFPKIKQVRQNNVDSIFKLPPSSPVESLNHSARSSSPDVVRDVEVQLPTNKPHTFLRPPTPDNTWEVVSSQSQRPIYSPRKARKPTPLFIKGSSSTSKYAFHQQQKGKEREISVPTSQEDEDEMTLEKALFFSRPPTVSFDAQKKREQIHQDSVVREAVVQVSVINRDSRACSQPTFSSFEEQVPSSKDNVGQCTDNSASFRQQHAEGAGAHRTRIFQFSDSDGSDRSTSGACNESTGSKQVILSEEQEPVGSLVIEDRASQQWSQHSSADIPSSMTVEESWTENPFPSSRDPVNILESARSANQQEKEYIAPSESAMNTLTHPSCTQSSETQNDEDDEDPFPTLPTPTGKMKMDFSVSDSAQRQSASPERRGVAEDFGVQQHAASTSQIMPEIGSVGDLFSMSMFTPRRVTAVLRTGVRNSSCRRGASPQLVSEVNLRMDSSMTAPLRDFLAMFEEEPGSTHG